MNRIDQIVTEINKVIECWNKFDDVSLQPTTKQHKLEAQFLKDKYKHLVKQLNGVEVVTMEAKTFTIIGSITDNTTEKYGI